MKMILLGLALILLSVPALAAEYGIDPASSKVSFAGTHAGNAFSGVFKTWQAEIVFDAQNLKDSHVRATFDLASATTGNAMFDGTLPQADWFDVKANPEGVFQSTAITHKQGDVYHVEGDFTLRGTSKPLGFDFSVSDLKGTPVQVHGAFVLDRLAYDIGKQSDPKAEWVGREIRVELDLSATFK